MHGWCMARVSRDPPAACSMSHATLTLAGALIAGDDSALAHCHFDIYVPPGEGISSKHLFNNSDASR